MTDSTTIDPQLMRTAAREHIIACLNRGTSVQTAIRSAITEGIDETVARAEGRMLKQDLIQQKKGQAMRRVRSGGLWILAAFVLAVVVPVAGYVLGTNLFVPGLFILVAGLVAGLLRIIASAVDYMTVESKVN